MASRNTYEEAIRLVLETGGQQGVEELRVAVGELGDVSSETLADTDKLLDSIAGLNDQAGKASELSRMTDQLASTEAALDAAQNRAYQLTLQLAAAKEPTRELQQAQKAARGEVERLEKAYADQWSALLKADAALSATGADTSDLTALQAQLRAEIGRTAVAIERQAQAVRTEATAVAQLKQRMAEGDAAFRKQAESSRAAGESLRQYRERAAAAERGTRELASASQTGSRFMARFAAVVGGLTSFLSVQGAWNATKQMLGLGDAAELTRKRLNRLYGEGAGDQAFDQIQQLARGASLQFDTLLQSALKLKSFGLEPLDGTLQGLVDQNAQLGGSMETLDGLILAVGQAWAKQKLQGEEILQLVERGVPVWDLLAQATGKNVQELQRLSSAGQLGRDVIKQLLDEMARASDGAAAENINTLSGLWRGFVDDVQSFARNVANSGALDWFKGQLRDIRDTIARMAADGSLDQWAKRVADAVVSVASAVKSGTLFLIEHRGALLLAAKAYAAFKIGGALVQMNQWRIALLNATNELVRQNTVITATGKQALSFGNIIRSIPTSVKIAVAMVGVDLAIRYGERLGEALAANSEAADSLRESQQAMSRDMLQSAAASAEAARGLEQYAHQQALSAEQVARLSEAERAGYAERLAGLREYLLALNSYFLRMEAAGALTPELTERWRAVQERLQAVNQAVADLGNGARVAGAALRNGITAGAQEVIDSLQGIDRDAKSANESIKRMFEGVNFADSNKLGDIGVALSQIAGGAGAADRNVRDGLLATLRTLSGEELLRFQTAAQAAFDVLEAGPANAAAVLDSTLVAALEKLGVGAERMGVKFTDAGRQATAAFGAILENANATGAQIETGFKAALSRVATLEEARALGALIRSAGEQGKIGFDQAERAAAALQTRIAQLTNALDPLAEEFSALGIQSQASLDAAAAAARRNFEAIRTGASQGKASVEDVRRAYLAYARTAREAVAESDSSAKARVESELEVLNAIYDVNDGLKEMGRIGGDAGSAVAAGASEAAQALENVRASGGAAGQAVSDVGDAAWEGRRGLYGAAQGAYTLAQGLGELSKAALDAYMATNSTISLLTSGGKDIFPMFNAINNVTDRIREQKEALDAELASLEKTAAGYDDLEERRAQIQRRFDLLGASQIEQVLQLEQQNEQKRKARLAEEERERAAQRAADLKRLEVADKLQEVAGAARIPVSDNKLTVVLEYPEPSSGGELSPQERRTADRILAYILPRLTRELARSKSLTVTQRPRAR